MKRRKNPERVLVSRLKGQCESFGILTKARMKLTASQTRGYIIRIGSILAVSIESRRKRCAQSEPESSKRAKYDEGEGVAEKEFQDATQAHQEPSDKVVSAHCSNAVSTRPPPPHELTGERAKAEEETEKCEGSRVAKCLSKSPSAIVRRI